MGTKLQCESYPLESYSMRNLNNNSSSSWSPYYEDKRLNEHLCHSFTLRPVNGYSGYDIMLKRTMLEHEAIFKKQVRELHRLYRTQKDLMAELKRRESCEFPVQTRTSQSFLFSSLMPSESTEKTWQFSKTPSKIDENFSPKGISKRMLDLQLPADEYIEADDSKGTEKECISKPLFSSSDTSSLLCDDMCESDVKLTLGSSDYWNGSVSNDFLNGRVKHEDISGHQSQMISNASFLTVDLFTDKHRDEGAHSNVLDGNKGESHQMWSPFDYNDGRKGYRVNSLNLDPSTGKSPLLSESPEPNLNTSHRFFPPGHSEMHTWFEEKPTLGIDTESYCSALTNSPVVLPRKKLRRDITHIPIAVQALPCFLPSKITKSINKRSLDGNLNSPVRVRTELTSRQNGFHLDLLSDSGSSLQFKHSSDSSVHENSEGPELPKDASFNQSLGNFLSSHIKQTKKQGSRAKVEYRTPINLNSIEILNESEVPSNTENFIHESLDSSAAETLMAMILDQTHHIASSSSSFDTLNWFANVISSEATETADYDDLFESLTLKLEEVKPDEYITPLKDLNYNLRDDDDPGGSFLLLTKPCRAYTRRRRQRKDFQKDILPGLVSLSRHQATEDFQAFQYLMSAMGEAWPCKLTKRSNGRKRNEKHPMPPIMEGEGPHLNVEVGEKSMVRWGRTTRRGRRVSVKPAGN